MGIVAIEIEFGMKREIGRDFQIAGADPRRASWNVDVILLDRLPAVIDTFIGFSRF